MCGKQELNGADSAQALANAIALAEAGYGIVPACIVCEQPADPGSVWCRQHRLRAEEEDRL